MKIKQVKKKDSYSIYISIWDKNKKVAWSYVYVLTNELHDEPFGLLENVYVEEDYRGSGIGTKIVKESISAAKKAGCYKLIGTSRTPKKKLHKFYEGLGFTKHGFEFRMDFDKKSKK